MENKNWSKKYMLILWTITLVVIVCGLAYNIGGFGMHLVSKSSAEYTDYDFSKEKFSSIEVDVDATDLDISYGDTYMVSSNIPEKYQPVIKVNEGKLKIQNKKFKQNFNSIKSLEDECNIEIIVPKGTKLDNVEIDVDAGDIDIKDIEGKKLEISADAGDIDVANINFEVTTISADAGSITAEDSNIGKLTIEADLGGIDIKNTDFTYGKLAADMGDITIDGSFEELDAYCDLGSIDITTPDPDRDKMNLDISLGSITVNGKNW